MSLFLQSTMQLPPTAPWWAAAVVAIALGLFSAISTIIVARAQRSANSAESEPLKAINKTLAEHGATLGDLKRRVEDCEHTIAEGTDPAVRHREEKHRDERVDTLEKKLVDLDREQREQTVKRHEADARMAASLATIEGYLKGRNESGRR